MRVREIVSESVKERERERMRKKKIQIFSKKERKIFALSSSPLAPDPVASPPLPNGISHPTPSFGVGRVSATRADLPRRKRDK